MQHQEVVEAKDEDVFLVRTLYRGEGETPWLHPRLSHVCCHAYRWVYSSRLQVLWCSVSLGMVTAVGTWM